MPDRLVVYGGLGPSVSAATLTVGERAVRLGMSRRGRLFIAVLPGGTEVSRLRLSLVDRDGRRTALALAESYGARCHSYYPCP